MKNLSYCTLISGVLIALTPTSASAALDCSNLTQWDANAVFVGGSEVAHKDIKYKANWWTQGADPSRNSGQWQVWNKLGECAGSEPSDPNKAPTVSLTILEGSAISVGDTITIMADAIDLDGDISSVQLFDNGAYVAKLTSAPFEWRLTPSVGSHQYSAVAIDNESAASDASNVVQVDVQDISYPEPTASLLPLSQTEFTQGQSVTLTVDAADVKNELSEVGFYNNGALLGYAKQAPYQFSFVPNIGEHRITAIAFNHRGQQSLETAAVVFKVVANEQPLPMPELTWLSPLANAAYQQGDNILLEVNAASPDSEGSIARVSFYANGQLLGVADQAPFNFAYVAATLGSIQLSAIAEDNQGISTESVRTINVAAIPVGGEYVYHNNFNQHALGAYTASDFAADWAMPANASSGIAAGRLDIVADPENAANPVLRVKYEAGQVGGGSASVFNYTLAEANHEQLWLQYKVRFDDNFTWVKGGKLPGLAGWDSGQKPTGCVTNSLLDGFSARFMWRENGHALSYQYSPVKQEYCGDYDSTYKFFKQGEWYTISTHVSLNNIGQSDGTIVAYIDGKQVLSLVGLTLRTNENVKINKLLFETFFGGSSSDWAPATAQYSYFDDIIISQESPLAQVNTQKAEHLYRAPITGYAEWRNDQTYPETTKVYRLDQQGHYRHYQARKYVHKNKDPLVESLPEDHLAIYNPVRLDTGQYWVLLNDPE
ncbi:hypothetical protein K6Y31_19025 [Motilimonas cestriensis]|uniref:Chitin-binding type-3 domain-containing protein n=1 Tax=Motilimonas cestriensis TaxID=2742685 RepID=A0ABS8WF01_9GAMM|nr:Ig-like domain-containing protein [Motilimonas cestriensis]MCE2596873.1 hypothetical protein [Motilimonas cestriensis]